MGDRTFKQFLDENGPTIKLRGTTNNTKITGFMNDYYAGTDPHPFDDRHRLWDMSIAIELSKFGDEIHISSIISMVTKNGGEASRALKWLCELADTHGVTMGLIAKPIDNAGTRAGKSLTKSQLVSWYKRYGFVASDGGDEMVRVPA